MKMRTNQINNFFDESKILSNIAFCNNYINRVNYLKRKGKINDYKYFGIQENLKNAEEIIIFMEELLNDRTRNL